MRKNNVLRLLDSRGLRYKAHELPIEKLGAKETAVLLGVEESLVYKTIVVAVQKPGKPLLVLVPGTATADLRSVAVAIGEKKVYLPTEREAEAMTGLQAGGISPLALLDRRFRVLIDSSARHVPIIHVSGGQRGLNIEIGVDDLATLTHATFAEFARSESNSTQRT